MPPKVTPGRAVAVSPVALRMPAGAVIFGSNVSIWLGPPCRNRKMTDLSATSRRRLRGPRLAQQARQRQAAQGETADLEKRPPVETPIAVVDGQHLHAPFRIECATVTNIPRSLPRITAAINPPGEQFPPPASELLGL